MTSSYSPSWPPVSSVAVSDLIPLYAARCYSSSSRSPPHPQPPAGSLPGHDQHVGNASDIDVESAVSPPHPDRLYGLGAGLGGPLGGWMNDNLGWCVYISRYSSPSTAEHSQSQACCIFAPGQLQPLTSSSSTRAHVDPAPPMIDAYPSVLLHTRDRQSQHQASSRD